MSTYVEPSEFARQYDKNMMYAVFEFQLPACDMPKAKHIIEDMRIMHNNLKVFVKHTCMCNAEGVTLWRFAYICDEYISNEISKRLIKIWDKRFAVVGRSANTLMYRGDGQEYANDLAPCVCPFSVK